MFQAVNEMVAAVKPRHSDTGISVSASATFTAAIPARAQIHRASARPKKTARHHAAQI